MKQAKLVVLISGSGTNLQAILDACAENVLPAQVVGVISNKAEAYGLERAKLAGIPAVVLAKNREESREEYDTRLANRVADFQPDWVVLAGWMRLLSSNFLNRYPGRVINLHPALPGAFPGTHAIERAYEAFRAGAIQKTGVMVHLVPDEGVDDGPLLATVDVAIHADDTLETLEARIHAAEHRLLVETLRRVLTEPDFVQG